MPGHAASHGRTSSSILQHSQGTARSFLKNPNERCCRQLDPDWWLLSFTHSRWSWTQSYFLHTKPNVLLQKSSVFIELTTWTKYTAYIVHVFCKEIFFIAKNFITNLPSAPNHSKWLWNKEGKQYSSFWLLIILIAPFKELNAPLLTKHIILFLYDNDRAKKKKWEISKFM